MLEREICINFFREKHALYSSQEFWSRPFDFQSELLICNLFMFDEDCGYKWRLLLVARAILRGK